MVQQLASMRITPEVQSFISGVLIDLDPVFLQMKNATQSDIEVRDDMYNYFFKLLEDVNVSSQSIVVAETAADNARIAHMNCRNVQLERWNKLKVCRSEESVLEADEISAKGALQAATTHFKNLLCGDKNVTNNLQAKIDAAGPFKQAGEHYLKAKALYDAKVEECKKNQTKYDGKKEDCDHSQETFERLMCDCGNKISGSCAAYLAKYNTHLRDYNLFQNQAVNRTTKRKFEWTHLKRIACALSTLANHKIDNHASLGPEIEACSQKSFSEPLLDFNVRPPPPPHDCRDPPPLPCVDEFKLKEYGHLKEGQKATTCRACT